MTGITLAEIVAAFVSSLHFHQHYRLRINRSEICHSGASLALMIRFLLAQKRVPIFRNVASQNWLHDWHCNHFVSNATITSSYASSTSLSHRT